jgi:hypothetical protein
MEPTVTKKVVGVFVRFRAPLKRIEDDILVFLQSRASSLSEAREKVGGN